MDFSLIFMTIVTPVGGNYACQVPLDFPLYIRSKATTNKCWNVSNRFSKEKQKMVLVTNLVDTMKAFIDERCLDIINCRSVIVTPLK